MDYDGHSYAKHPESVLPDETQNTVAAVNHLQTIDVDKVFLNIMQGHVKLYDPDHEDYGKRDSNESEWKLVVGQTITKLKELASQYSPEAVNTFVENVSVTYLKQRWRLLRQYFSAERIKRSKLVDTLTVHSGFQLYNDMEFFGKFIVEKKDKRKANNKDLRKTASKKWKKDALNIKNTSCQSHSAPSRNENDDNILVDNVVEKEVNEKNASDDNNHENLVDKDLKRNVTGHDLKRATRSLQVEKSREALRILTENRTKQMMEENENKIQEQALKDEERKRHGLRNEACANTIASMLSSTNCETKRKSLAAKIFAILYEPSTSS